MKHGVAGCEMGHIAPKLLLGGESEQSRISGLTMNRTPTKPTMGQIGGVSTYKHRIKEKSSIFSDAALGATGRIRTSGLPGRRTVTDRQIT